jgi:hypothetical protein
VHVRLILTRIAQVKISHGSRQHDDIPGRELIFENDLLQGKDTMPDLLETPLVLPDLDAGAVMPGVVPGGLGLGLGFGLGVGVSGSWEGSMVSFALAATVL